MQRQSCNKKGLFKEMSVTTDDIWKIVLSGDYEQLKKITESPTGDMTVRDEAGNSILHYAARSSNLKMIQYLVEKVGMNPLSGNSYGITAWDIARSSQNKAAELYFEEYLGFTYAESYHNPIRRGFFPDPSMVRVGEDYYMVNSTFTYFPSIPISHSKDLLHWTVIGYAITDPAYAHLDLLDGGMGYWAPDISYCDGRFYIVATLRLNQDMERRRVQMVTSSLRPEGPYGKPAFLDIDGIDPSLYHSEDGRHYMLINKGAWIVELNKECSQMISEPVLLWYGDCKYKPEGPHLIHWKNFYYLFLAEGGTGMGHQITVARSENMMGPYEPCPYNPILTQKDKHTLIQCTGHGKPIQMQDGRWCIPYLCLRKPGNGMGIIGRETAIDLLEWTENDWPVINSGRGPSQQAKKFFVGDMSACLGSEYIKKYSPYPNWAGQDWMTPRPMASDSIYEKDGHLFLRGQREDLCSKDCRSVFVKRQEEFVFSASCSFRLSGIQPGKSLGLVCYYDENSYIKYGVTVGEDGYQVLLQEYVGDEYRREIVEQIPKNTRGEDDIVSLTVDVDYLCRSFTWKHGAQTGKTMTLSDTSYLASEGLSKGKRFTGATVGVYVHGEFWGEFIEWK